MSESAVSGKRVPAVAMDIGASHVRAAVYFGGELMGRVRAPWPAMSDVSEDLAFVAETARRAIVDAGMHGVRSAGVALAALADRSGVIVSWPNRPSWNGADALAALQAELDLPCQFLGDGHAALAAETRLGAARGSTDVALICIGTGIGGAILLNGSTLGGRSGWAGEVGHVIVSPGGPVCSCGRRGCLQALASGRCWEARAMAAGHDVQSFALAADRGETSAATVLEELGAWIGLGAANLVSLLDLEGVVLSGRLTRLSTAWWNATQRSFLDHLPSFKQRNVFLRRSDLGDDAGLLGAGLVAADPL